ncbi:hypothetical protein SLEP1_g57276 [Rubroshorea leprosula]|uniref:Secreted protein n=1 Tax=Rubroshorea leprosula TaxID=152421 RepID=A0AAV5MNJ9_9ROSI|nr:hypothetical protein SLEP1_g57276 [Rubroshorea leprosula]
MDIPFFMNSMNLLLLFFSRFSYGTDIITSFENLIDGRTLVSSDGSFELGFFSSGSSGRSCYLGIWFRKVSVQGLQTGAAQ